MYSGSRKYTLLGFLTILIWGTSAVFTRNLSINIGAFTSAALVNLIGGAVVLFNQFIRKEGLKEVRQLSFQYWLVCGLLFIFYTASSYVSMAMVESDAAVVTLVLIRFLWPLFTLIFTIPILGARASWWLVGAVVVSMAGIAVVKLGENIFDFSNFIGNMLEGGDIPGYVVGLLSAISWGLYTNLTKKYVGTKKADGVGIYMLLTGIVLGGIALLVEEPRQFSFGLIMQILYAGIIVGSAANIFWSLAIKKGNMLLVILVSNFLPVISSIITSCMLGVGITIPILAGAFLVVIGTLWSKTCFKVIK